MNPLNFYTLAEAVDYLNESPEQIFRDVEAERLPICFCCDGELDGVCIELPDGTFENIALTVPFSGVLRSLVPPKSADLLTASLVQILESNGYKLEHCDGVLAKGCVLPLTDGRVSDGFTVTGFLNFVAVPSSEWLFLGSDALALAPPSVPAPIAPPSRGVNTRDGVLDPIIRKAINLADSTAPIAVFLILRDMALEGETPFTGEICADGALAYRDKKNAPQELSSGDLARLMRKYRK